MAVLRRVRQEGDASKQRCTECQALSLLPLPWSDAVILSSVLQRENKSLFLCQTRRDLQSWLPE